MDRGRIMLRNIKLVLDDKAKDFLVEKGFDPQFGARPMRRSVERFLEDPLAEEVLRGNLQGDIPVDVSCENGRLVFHQQAAASAPPAPAT